MLEDPQPPPLLLLLLSAAEEQISDVRARGLLQAGLIPSMRQDTTASLRSSQMTRLSIKGSQVRTHCCLLIRSRHCCCCCCLNRSSEASQRHDRHSRGPAFLPIQSSIRCIQCKGRAKKREGTHYCLKIPSLRCCCCCCLHGQSRVIEQDNEGARAIHTLQLMEP